MWGTVIWISRFHCALSANNISLRFSGTPLSVLVAIPVGLFRTDVPAFHIQTIPRCDMHGIQWLRCTQKRTYQKSKACIKNRQIHFSAETGMLQEQEVRASPEHWSAAMLLALQDNNPFDNIPVLVQIIAWRRPGDKSLSEPMMVNILTHLLVPRPQRINQYTQQFIWSGKFQHLCNLLDQIHNKLKFLMLKTVFHPSQTPYWGVSARKT